MAKKLRKHSESRERMQVSGQSVNGQRFYVEPMLNLATRGPELHVCVLRAFYVGEHRD